MHPSIHLAESTIGELPVGDILKVTICHNRSVDLAAVTKRWVGVVDGPQQSHAISQVHLGVARLLMSEAEVLVSVGARWNCHGHSDMDQVVSVDQTLQGGPPAVEAEWGDFKEHGGSRDAERGMVEQTACIILVGSAGGLEQDVFPLLDGS